MKEWKDRRKYYVDGEVSSKPRKKYFFTGSVKRQRLVMVISVLAVFLVMFGTSYAVFSSVNKSGDYNGITVGDLHITYKDESGAISLTDSFPKSDSEGLSSRPYSFSIQNTGSLATTYSVQLLDDEAVISEEEENDPDIYDKLLDYNDIKVSVNGGSPVILNDLSINNCEILSGKLQPGETKKINVRLWIKSDASNDIFFKDENENLIGKYYFGKIVVSGKNTKTYETNNMLLWLDANNNDENGHNNSVSEWFDLSNNGNFSMDNFNSYSWNNKALNINGSISSIGFNYDVSSLETYSMSLGFKLNSNNGQVNIFNTNDINVYLSNNKLMYGDVDSGITLDNNKVYTVTLVKKKKYVMKTDGTKESNAVLECYVNGEFSKDITTANKVDITTSNIDIDLYNYLVYSKALSLNQDNNNYILTSERYGD